MKWIKQEWIWLALPILISAIWFLFGSISDASYAKAKVDSLAQTIEQISIDIAVIKRDVQYLREKK